MANKSELETIWHVPDEMWRGISEILGPEKAAGTVGRPAVAYRIIFDAIIYVMRTGCQWQAIPREKYAPGSTVHGRFRQWVKAGVFEQAWQLMLEVYDDLVGIDWKWQAMDGVITKAPLGGEDTGPSPVDRGKKGTKRSILTDRRGAPLAIVVTKANTNDKTVALETLDAIIVNRPEKVVNRLHHLCLDKGYDYDDVIEGVLARDYIMHLKKRGVEEKPVDAKHKHPPRRWVVERTHSWHNNFRRLLVRWEKKSEHYLALLHIASAFIIYRIVANILSTHG
jgi:putative transposase